MTCLSHPRCLSGPIDLLKFDLIDNWDDFSEVYQNIPDKMIAAKAYLMEMCKNFCTEDFSC